MAKTYAVWLEVEEIDEDAENYETLDLPFGRLATFDSPEKAMAFASGVQHLHERGVASELLEALIEVRDGPAWGTISSRRPELAAKINTAIAKAEGVDHG